MRFGLVPLDIPVDIGRDEARRRAMEELAKGKYAGLPPWLRQWLQRALDWFWEWADRMARGLLDPPTAGGGINWTFLVTVLAVFGLIVLVAWRVGLPRLNARRRDATVQTDTTVRPRTYRERADRAAAAGDWPNAVGERFRAIVRSLEELTVIDPRPARTAWEVARLAGRTVPAAQRPLDGAAQLFNDVEYGDVAVTEDAYRLITGWDIEIVDLARSADLVEPAEPEPVGGRR